MVVVKTMNLAFVLLEVNGAGHAGFARAPRLLARCAIHHKSRDGFPLPHGWTFVPRARKSRLQHSHRGAVRWK